MARERITPSAVELIQDLQNSAWRKGDWENKKWWTPIPCEYLRQVIDKSFDKELLVVGCGRGNRELLVAKDIGWQATAFDINEGLVRQVDKDSAFPLVGDLFHLPFREKGDFAAALMVGIATSLIGRNLDKALTQIASRISSCGYLIISDFSITLPGLSPVERIESDRGLRYIRDASAIQKIIGDSSWETIEEIIGLAVIRPRGLSWREALNLSLEELIEALEEGDFERLVQHRGLESFKRALNEADFSIINHQLELAFPLVVELEEEKRAKEDAIFNIQILAQRN